MKSFRLHCTEGDDGAMIVRVNSPAGQVTESRRIDSRALANWLKAAADLIPDDRQVWRSKSSADRDTADYDTALEEVRVQLESKVTSVSHSDLGRELYETFFVGEVLRLFDESRGGAEKTAQVLPIEWHFELEDPFQARLATLPWEELYDPARRIHLAHSEVTPVVRFLRYAGVTRKVRQPQVLKVLVVSATTADLPPLQVSVSHLVKDWPQANIIVERLVDPDREALRRKVLEGFHVLHFDGHGGFDPESGVGSIALVGADGKADWVSGPVLASWFLNNPGLRLVLLNTCLGGADGGRTAFAGVASALVRSGVPAVVAMRRPIPDDDAVRFARALYSALTAGRPLEASLSLARHELFNAGSAHWSTPVLSSHTDEVFSIPADIRPALARAYSWLGLVTANIAFNAWSQTQGGPALPGIGFKDVNELSVPILGMLAVAPLLFILLLIVLRYQGVTRERGLFFRLPVAFGLPVESHRGLANFYQLAILAIFIVIPILSQFQFLRQIYIEPSWSCKSSDDEFAERLRHLTKYRPPDVLFSHDYCFGPQKDGKNRNAKCAPMQVCEVTFFPFWQPWAYLLIHLLNTALVVLVFVGIWTEDPLKGRRFFTRKRCLALLIVTLAVICFAAVIEIPEKEKGQGQRPAQVEPVNPSDKNLEKTP